MGSVIKYLRPWKLKREREAARLSALRQRDGDNCARCRRPLRFDLPAGHDQGAKVEPIRSSTDGKNPALADLCLTHGRCNPGMVDHTDEVTTRARLKNEAALFAKSRRRRKKAA